MLSAPLADWRHVKVTDRHTKIDWAELIGELVDEHYPDKRRIVLVMDNLNTHKLPTLYEAFEPAEARPDRRTVGNTLHPETRELVEHGRN